jgi:maleylpyruvate isomerase
VLAPEWAISELAVATGQLLADIEGLADGDVAQPSLLPGWTRGHVLAHLARNAEGGIRLLTWARTGVPTQEYPSPAARETAIATSAKCPAASLIEDVRATATRFAAAISATPGEAWERMVRYTVGTPQKAAVIVPARLTEVLFHHVDLDLDYKPRDWPAWFTRQQLTSVISSLTSRSDFRVAARLEAADTCRVFQLGDLIPGMPLISGAECELVAWLYGRSNGAGLTREPPGGMPEIPRIY